MKVNLRNKLTGNYFLLVVTVLLFFILYIAGMAIFSENGFGKPQVFLNLFISNTGLIIAAVGMTIVLIAAGIDISIGAVVAMTCMLLAWMMEKKGMDAWTSIAVILIVGTVFGLVQGYLIAYLKIQPFIVTLAGMFFARGMTAVISDEMITITNKSFLAIANAKIYLPFISTTTKKGKIIHPYIYPSVLLAILVLVVAFIILKYTKFGRSIYAVGGNEQAAVLMGLNVRKIKLKVYALNGFLAALAGFAFALGSCGGFVEQARGFEMDAIAAVVIGGTLLTGGVGNVIGSLFGVMIKGTIESLITFQGNLSSWWTKIAIALLLCLFIVFQSLFSAIKTKGSATLKR